METCRTQKPSDYSEPNNQLYQTKRLQSEPNNRLYQTRDYSVLNNRLHQTKRLQSLQSEPGSWLYQNERIPQLTHKTPTRRNITRSGQLRFCIMLSYSIWHDDDDVTAQPTVAKTMIKVPSFQCGRHTCVAAGKRKAGVICNQCTVG